MACYIIYVTPTRDLTTLTMGIVLSPVGDLAPGRGWAGHWRQSSACLRSRHSWGLRLRLTVSCNFTAIFQIFIANNASDSIVGHNLREILLLMIWKCHMIHDTSPVIVLVTSLQNVTKNLILFSYSRFFSMPRSENVLFFLQIPPCILVNSILWQINCLLIIIIMKHYIEG